MDANRALTPFGALKIQSVVALAASLAVCFAAAAMGAALTKISVDDWYPALAKPSWNPPQSVFPVVWTALFAMMAVAAWLVWLRQGMRAPLVLFAVQLALNVAWSGIFFALRRPDLALVEVVFLWAAILAATVAFFRVRPLAAWLLTPYLAWVGFAALLNFTIWRLNG